MVWLIGFELNITQLISKCIWLLLADFNYFKERSHFWYFNSTFKNNKTRHINTKCISI